MTASGSLDKPLPESGGVQIRGQSADSMSSAQTAFKAFSVVVAVAASCVAVAGGEQGLSISQLLFLVAVFLGSRFGSRQWGAVFAVAGFSINLGCVILLALPSGSVSLTATVQMGLFGLIAFLITLLTERGRQAQVQQHYYANLSDAVAADVETGVLVLDAAGLVTFLNSTAARLLGWGEHELIGQQLHHAMHDAEGLACSELEEQACDLKEVLSPASGRRNGAAVFVAKDASQLRVLYTASPLRPAGEGQGLVVTFRDVTEHTQTLNALQQSEERYRTLVESSPDGILVTDLYGYVTVANERAAGVYGYVSTEEIIGVRAVELIEPEDRLRILERSRSVLSDGGVGRDEYTALRPDGTTFPVEIRTTLVTNDRQVPEAFIHACTDITERRRTEHALQVREVCDDVRHAGSIALARSVTLGDAAVLLLRAICESGGWDIGAYWSLNIASSVLECRHVWHQPALDCADFLDVSRQLSLVRDDDLPGQAWSTRQATWHPDFATEVTSRRVLVASRTGIATGLAVPVLTGGEVCGVLEFLTCRRREPDPELMKVIVELAGQLGLVVERKSAEKALEHQARHDALTGLPNRALLRDRLERAIGAVDNHGNPLSLLILDLDRFKAVNDTLGHHMGDLLLQEVSSRLRGHLRDSDTVARLGGDEFAVLMPATDAEGAERVAEKIIAAIAPPCFLQGQKVDVGTSIGIAICPEHGRDVEALMQRADVAMYAAKRAKSGYAVYAADQDEHSPLQLTLLADLRQAVQEKRLSVHYQPKVNLKTGRIESVEALARWHHPQHGPIPPEQFIRFAEQSGLIRPLSYIILEEVLRQCGQWQQERIHLRVAVNLTAENLCDPRLVETIAGFLDRHELGADYLAIEITESSVLGSAGPALETLRQLDEMGVRIAIDDFGTGYSSLVYLKCLPVHEIKIEKAFVLGMDSRDNDAFITQSVIDLGHNLGLEVVAEGVETLEVWDMLGGMGCDHVQGFYLAKPLTAVELKRWLHDSPWRVGRARHVSSIDGFCWADQSGS